MTPRRHIYLIGFSGSGKSTVGPLLAQKLGIPFRDIDHEVERLAGLTIAELFEEQGERGFRSLESEAIFRQGGQKNRSVIALGGGAYQSLKNRKFINSTGITIYLRCSIAEIYRRIKGKSDRPLLRGSRAERLRRIKSLLVRRIKTYQLADLTVSTSNHTPAETVRLIRRQLKERHGDS